MIEASLAHNGLVAGSSPARPTNKPYRLSLARRGSQASLRIELSTIAAAELTSRPRRRHHARLASSQPSLQAL
jgi:hypothetical protein